jgi:hypothetical protein
MSPDGGLVISGGRGGQAFLWQVLQHQQGASPSATEPLVLRHVLGGHASSTQVKCCCLAADGRWAATGGSDGTVILWDLSALLPAEQAVASVAASAAAGGGSTAHSSSVSCCMAAPGDSQVRQAERWHLGRDHASCITLAAGARRSMAFGTRAGRVYLVPDCSSGGGEQRVLLQLPARHMEGCKVRCAALSPDASKLLTSADDARLLLWDLASRSCVLAVHEHTKPIRCCCWSPDGRHVATVGDDSLLCVLDVVLLGSSSGKHRVAMWLNGAAAEAADAAAEAAGEGLPAPRAVPPHPLLRRMDVSMLRERLLACVPLPPPPTQHSSLEHGNGCGSSNTGRAEGMLQDGVLCADQAGLLLLLPPGCAAAVPTGLSTGSSIACCAFDGGVVAAAKRDGAVTVMSCAPGAAAAAAASAASTPLAASFIGAFAPPAAAASAAAAVGGELPVAVSAKLDMLVLGLSVCRALGRVALVGCERKATQTGVAQLWEFDPSVRPAVVSGGEHAGGRLSGSDSRALLDRGESNRSMLSSHDSASDSVASPSRLSMDLDSGGLGGLPAAAAGRGSGGGAGFWDHSSWAAGGAGHHKAGGGRAGQPAANMRVSSNAELGPSGASAGSNVGGPAGWLWHCDNPVKVLSCPEAPLLCCAWAVRGDRPRLVVGSAAGWLTVINLELEDTMVRWRRVGGLI